MAAANHSETPPTWVCSNCRARRRGTHRGGTCRRCPLCDWPMPENEDPVPDIPLTTTSRISVYHIVATTTLASITCVASRQTTGRLLCPIVSREYRKRRKWKTRARPREQCISLLAVAATRMHGQQKLAAPPLIPATSVLLLVERNTVSCGKHPNYIICGAILLRVSFVDQRSRVPIFSSIALATI